MRHYIRPSTDHRRRLNHFNALHHDSSSAADKTEINNQPYPTFTQSCEKFPYETLDERSLSNFRALETKKQKQKRMAKLRRLNSDTMDVNNRNLAVVLSGICILICSMVIISYYFHKLK